MERTFWDSSLLVSLTLWDAPVLFTPPLPLPQVSPSVAKIRQTKKVADLRPSVSRKFGHNKVHKKILDKFHEA